MTADIELLPLPAETEGNPWIGYKLWDVRKLQDYALDVAEHNVKKRDDEIEALRAEVERLRALAGCAYQMAGMHDAPLVWLDRLTEAANGDALPDADTLMDELLPYQPDAVCEAEARAERLAEALRKAEEYIDDVTPTWASGGQGVLAVIRAALRDRDQETKK